jgi:hypothetical protein
MKRAPFSYYILLSYDNHVVVWWWVPMSVHLPRFGPFKMEAVCSFEMLVPTPPDHNIRMTSIWIFTAIKASNYIPFLLLWWWKHQVSPKQWYTSTRLPCHCILEDCNLKSNFNLSLTSFFSFGFIYFMCWKSTDEQSRVNMHLPVNVQLQINKLRLILRYNFEVHVGDSDTFCYQFTKY